MRGGKRPGAGRPKGAKDKIKAAEKAAMRAAGLMPLDYMLQIVRDPTVEYARRDHMAKAAAPFCHPTLASTKHTGDGPDGAIVVQINKTTFDD